MKWRLSFPLAEEHHPQTAPEDWIKAENDQREEDKIVPANEVLHQEASKTTPSCRLPEQLCPKQMSWERDETEDGEREDDQPVPGLYMFIYVELDDWPVPAI